MIPENQVTVLLVDDHTIVRQSLQALLKTDRRFAVAGEACNGCEAVEMARTLRPDVILMDFTMPVLNGLEATRQILAANPAVRVIILSAHSDDVHIQLICEVGVAGYLEKQSSAAILTQAIQEVAMGRTYFSPAVAKRLRDQQNRPRDRDGFRIANPTHLTRRETEVLKLVAEGSANKQVATALGISLKTVEKHRQHLMDKLNIHDTAGLTRHAIAAGVVAGDVPLAPAQPGRSPMNPHHRKRSRPAAIKPTKKETP